MRLSSLLAVCALFVGLWTPSGYTQESANDPDPFSDSMKVELRPKWGLMCLDLAGNRLSDLSPEAELCGETCAMEQDMEAWLIYQYYCYQAYNLRACAAAINMINDQGCAERCCPPNRAAPPEEGQPPAPHRPGRRWLNPQFPRQLPEELA